MHFNRTNELSRLCSQICAYLENPSENAKPKVNLRDCKVQGSLLYKGGLLWVPEDGLKEVHDQIAVGHPGIAKTTHMIRRHLFWPKIKNMIKRYINNCHVCRRAQVPHDTYNGLLQPLPVPERPWLDVTMVLITGLPKCQLYDAISVIMDRLLKEC